MCAFVLGLPESKVRVIAPDVGGGFGSKIFLYAEETALVWASKRVGRPIKWTAERSEAFLTDAHGRDHATQGRARARRRRQLPRPARAHRRQHGRVPVDLRVVRADHPLRHAARRPVHARRRSTPRCRRSSPTPRRSTPTAAPAAPRRPILVERIVEQAARELGVDPAELRRRNFITEFPYATPVGLTYDIGDYAAHLDRAVEMADVAGFPARREAGEGARQAARPGLLLLHRGLRPGALERRRRARRARRAVRGRRGARPPDRQRHRLHRLAQPRPGPRDDLRAGRRRPARHPGRERRDRARRHRPRALRHGHLRQPLAGRRRHAPSSRRSTRSSPRARRSPPTCWRRPTPTSSSRAASSGSPAPTARCRWATSR